MRKHVSLCVLAFGLAACGREPNRAGEVQVAAPASAAQTLVVDDHKVLLAKAAQGDVAAAKTLARLYATGDGMPIDGGKAARYYQIAADGGDAQALHILAQYYRAGRWLPLDYQRARELADKAERTGEKNASVTLAMMELRGEGITKDTAKAVSRLKELAANGVDSALHHLGNIYADGEGVQRDAAMALQYRLQAADRGSTADMFMAAQALRDGDGVKRDPVRAMRLWELAATNGDLGSMTALAAEYRLGEIVPRNDKQSFDLMLKAAIAGDYDAQIWIADDYAEGVGTASNASLAYVWASIAATNPALSNRTVRVNGVIVDPYERARQEAAPTLLRSERKMSPAEVTEAQRVASDWKKGLNPTNLLVSASVATKSSGTAFFVTVSGHALTNAHVVQGCRKLSVRGGGEQIAVVAQDSPNDLALVKVEAIRSEVGVIPDDRHAAKQGDEVFVYGFPLAGVLSSGGNLSQGIVSAIAGFANNSSQIQISAPIQPGSSGSPVLDRKGRVVGIVSMKISDRRMLAETGQAGQTVNFAVNARTAAAFLRANGVEVKEEPWFMREMTAQDLASMARQWTVPVDCER